MFTQRYALSEYLIILLMSDPMQVEVKDDIQKHVSVWI